MAGWITSKEADLFSNISYSVSQLERYFSARFDFYAFFFPQLDIKLTK